MQSIRGSFNAGGWLILLDILNEWVAEGVTSDPQDFILTLAHGIHCIITLLPFFTQKNILSDIEASRVLQEGFLNSADWTNGLLVKDPGLKG